MRTKQTDRFVGEWFLLVWKSGQLTLAGPDETHAAGTLPLMSFESETAAKTFLMPRIVRIDGSKGVLELDEMIRLGERLHEERQRQ